MKTAIKENYTEDLIKEFASIGVTISAQEINEILTRGADSFLHDRSIEVSEKHLTPIYLVIHEMKENNF